MSDPIRFYFDFSSPYSYFAAHKIDATVEGCGRTCEWKPFLLGALFKITDSKPLTMIPMKGEYCRHDWERLAKMMDIPWTMPDPFPIPTQAAARAFGLFLRLGDLALVAREQLGGVALELRGLRAGAGDALVALVEHAQQRSEDERVDRED